MALLLQRLSKATGPEAGSADSLPIPPTDSEKYSYVGRRLKSLVVLSIIGMIGLSISMVNFSLMSPFLWGFLGILGVTLLYYLISMRVNAFSRDFDLAGHEALVNAWEPTRYPSIDVFLPVCGENTTVLRNAWQYVKDMHYPGHVTVYCLDDGASAEVEAMAQEFGFEYLSRPDRGWFKKSGNLRYGFQYSNGEFIAIFDADFCPRREFLMELMPYHDADPTLGIVQSPQYFHVERDQNWLERGAGAVQEYFYRVVQTSREYRNGSICVGTNAIYRRAALRENGGPTLIEHSEDVHTGFDLRRKGWGLRYVPVLLATGICPDNVPAFFRQQYRWCMGSMSLLRSRKFWETDLSLVTRLCYLSGFCYYLYTAAFIFIMPLAPLVMLYAFPELVNLMNYVALAPGIAYAVIVFPAWHKCRYRSETWSVRMLYGWAHAFAILDIFRGSVMPWESTGTGANGSGRRYAYFRRLITLWGGLTAVAWVAAAGWNTATLDPIAFLPLLLAGIFYVFSVGRIVLMRTPGTEN